MKKIFTALALFALPLVAGAQLGNIGNIVDDIGDIVDVATPVIVGIALLAFFWGLARFIFSAGDEEAQGKGKQIMLWGIIALFVMVSIWGIVRFIGDAVGVDPDETPQAVPRVPGI